MPNSVTTGLHPSDRLNDLYGRLSGQSLDISNQKLHMPNSITTGFHQPTSFGDSVIPKDHFSASNLPFSTSHEDYSRHNPITSGYHRLDHLDGSSKTELTVHYPGRVESGFPLHHLPTPVRFKESPFVKPVSFLTDRLPPTHAVPFHQAGARPEEAPKIVSPFLHYDPVKRQKVDTGSISPVAFPASNEPYNLKELVTLTSLGLPSTLVDQTKFRTLMKLTGLKPGDTFTDFQKELIQSLL